MNDKLSLEQVLSQAAGNPDPIPDPVPTPVVPTPVVPTPVVPAPAPAPTPAPVVPDPIPTPGDPTDPTDPKPNPIKDLREKYNSEKTVREKNENAIKKFTEGDYTFKLKEYLVDGKVDYDGLAKAMETADVKAKAETRGISPEVQQEIERIDKEKIELEKQKLQVSMDRALTNMQIDLGIKGTDINNFFKDSMELKKNPYQWIAQGGDLRDLYNLVYREKLIKTQVDKSIAEARIAWDAEAKLQNKVPVANPAQPTIPSAINTNGLSLESLLEEAAKNKR